MAAPQFTPDDRYEKVMSLLDRAMNGDKEILNQIIRRGGFSKQELQPVMDYAKQKWAAKGLASTQLSDKELADLKAVNASPEEIAAYQKRLGEPVDVGAQYGMFLRDEPAPTPAPISEQEMADLKAVDASPEEIAAYQKKPGSAPKAAKKPNIKQTAKLPEIITAPDAPMEQKLGEGLLRMLGGVAAPIDSSVAGRPGIQSAPPQPEADIPAPQSVPMPYTVFDSYGRPLDSPADQLPPTDDMAEMQRRMAEGASKRKQLEESYRRSAGQ